MSDRITSVHNPHIKEAVKLRERGGRTSQRRIIIDGAREILRALDADVDVVELFVCQESLRSESQHVVDRAVEKKIYITAVSPAVQAKLAFGDRNEGVVAIAHTPDLSLDQLILPENSVIAVIEGVEKPGNVGAVVRSADAAGVAAVIAADAGTDLFNPNTIRASAGTVFTVPLVAASAVATRDWLRAREIGIFTARIGGSHSYTSGVYTGAVAFVLGSESTGLSPLWNDDDMTGISLPLLGVADSLNVSVTAAVLFYEALRQRRATPPPPTSQTRCHDFQ